MSNNYQDVSTDSTATNTIPTSHAQRPGNKAPRPTKSKIPAETKKNEPEPIIVHLVKNPLRQNLTACVKKPLIKGNEKIVVPILKCTKTPEKLRENNNITPHEESAKRNKTPNKKVALLHTTGTGPLKHHSSKKDVVKALYVMPGASNMRSRNKGPLGESNNELVVRTKPEEGNVSMNVSIMIPQQLLSNRKEFVCEERRNSAAKQTHILHSRSHYRTFYGKHGKNQDDIPKHLGKRFTKLLYRDNKVAKGGKESENKR